MSNYSENPNIGHGHVFPRPDGVRARCGGPGICMECSHDLARSQKIQKAHGVIVSKTDMEVCDSLPLQWRRHPIATGWGYEDFFRCPECRALVDNQTEHTNWHAADRVLRGGGK